MIRNGKSNKKKNKTVNSWSDGQVFTAANIKKKRQMKGMYIYFVLHLINIYFSIRKKTLRS